MTSKIKENMLFYLASTREKSRSIAIGHDLDLKSELVIKLLIKNCRFKFDVMLLDGLKSSYSEFKFDNVYSLFDSLMSVEQKLKLQSADELIASLERSVCNVYPDRGLIVDSINLLILNFDAVRLNKFINHLLSKYSKVIFLFNSDLVDRDYLTKIQELSSAHFELNRSSLHSNEIQVNYVYKKRCSKLGIDPIKEQFWFTFHSNTLDAKLLNNQNLKQSDRTDQDYALDLSFNLAIREEDKRVQTVLPFMRAQNTSSKVYYVPDKSDDVDEEDPDDVDEEDPDDLKL